jgi:hypothetical protein
MLHKHFNSSLGFADVECMFEMLFVYKEEIFWIEMEKLD